jgi:hypothetical protein
MMADGFHPVAIGIAQERATISGVIMATMMET